MNQDERIRPFILNDSHASHHALKFWLRDRKYNIWMCGSRDKKGDLMIGLSYDHNPDDDHLNDFEKCGVVICKSEECYNKALEIVEANAIE